MCTSGMISESKLLITVITYILRMASRSIETYESFHNDAFPYTPRLDQLPTDDDVVHYYVTHMKTKKDSKNKVMRNIANMTVKIWSSADCFPKSLNSVVKMVEPLLVKYRDYQQGRGRQTGRKARKSDDVPILSQPTRRSKRLNKDVSLVASNFETKVVSSSDAIAPPKKSRLSRRTQENPYKDEWLQDIGSQLFDIVSEEQKKQYDDSIKAGKEPKKFFDLDFYNDQKGQRI